MSPIELGLAVWLALTTALALWALFRTYRLETTMNERLDTIDRKLDTLPTLATKQDIVNANQETINQILFSLGVRPAVTTIGTVQTGGGGAAIGGNVSDQRKDP